MLDRKVGEFFFWDKLLSAAVLSSFYALFFPPESVDFN